MLFVARLRGATGHTGRIWARPRGSLHRGAQGVHTGSISELLCGEQHSLGRRGRNWLHAQTRQQALSASYRAESSHGPLASHLLTPSSPCKKRMRRRTRQPCSQAPPLRAGNTWRGGGGRAHTRLRMHTA